MPRCTAPRCTAWRWGQGGAGGASACTLFEQSHSLAALPGLSCFPAAFAALLIALTTAPCPPTACLPCLQVMISGVTGEPFPVDVYMGVVYYQRLRHMVLDKFQVRRAALPA